MGGQSMPTVNEGQGIFKVLKPVALVVLVISVFASALCVIYFKHCSRQYFTELQNLQQASENLHVEWSQLLVEQGTWASDVRVDKVARQHLNMLLPAPQDVVVIR